jgi:hypothetical protein
MDVGTAERIFRPFVGPEFAQFVTGEAWALWLTGRLLEGLGGTDRVKREAPVELVIERQTGLWLQLTDDPFAPVSDAVFQRLALYLAPITPTVEQLKATGSPPAGPSIELTPDDEYAGTLRAPVPIRWVAPNPSEIVPIQVVLQTRPRRAQANALERALLAWHRNWSSPVQHAPLHDLEGPVWSGARAIWELDAGMADVEQPLHDLARRLAGWAAQWDLDVQEVRLGSAVN